MNDNVYFHNVPDFEKIVVNATIVIVTYSAFLQLLLATYIVSLFSLLPLLLLIYPPSSNRGVNDFAFFVGTTVQEETGQQSVTF